MKNRIAILILICILQALTTVQAQDLCSGRIEKIIGAKGTNYTIPCTDMVILDIATYSKYRYMEKQYQAMDSAMSGYTSRIDSLDRESIKNRALLEEKIKDKEHIIERYKLHSRDVTAVLEKCKTDSETFVKNYQQKLDENRALETQVKKLKRQRRGMLGITGGLAVVVLLVLL